MRKRLKMEPGVKSVLFGVLAGECFFLLASVVFAFVLTKKDVAYPTIACVCFVVTAAASFIAGYIGKRRCKLKGIYAGMIASAAIIVPIVLLAAVVNRFGLCAEVFLLFPVGLLCGAIGGIISSNAR